MDILLWNNNERRGKNYWQRHRESKGDGRSFGATRRRMCSIVAAVSGEVRCKHAVNEQGISVWRIGRGVGRGVCSASCAEIHPRWVVGEAPGGRYVGQQHASLTVPMSQFAKSSNGTIRLRSISGIKTWKPIVINNGYQFSWRRWSSGRSSTFLELY